ncbi:MAG: hypothetical protein LBK56_02720 [Gracilibacteraceae bacterium]|nr:hypothetical protein [Gracilibacteraceae bacterium]
MKKLKQKTAALFLLLSLLLTLAPVSLPADNIALAVDLGSVVTEIAGNLEAMAADLQAMETASLQPQYGSNGQFLAPIDAPDPSAIPISSRADLAKIGADSAYPLNGSYKLTADIDLSGAEWAPIGDGTAGNRIFTGTFDGQGHVISNLTITGNNHHQYNGLFGAIESAIVKNIGLRNTRIDVSSYNSSSYAGGICGYADASSSVTISNCYNMGNVSSYDAVSYAGGICGYVFGSDSITISDCYNLTLTAKTVF